MPRGWRVGRAGSLLHPIKRFMGIGVSQVLVQIGN